MTEKSWSSAPSAALFVVLFAAVFSLSAGQGHTLILNGQSTDVSVIFVSNHPYVDLQALASALNGSVASSGAVVTLSIPNSAAPSDAPPAPAAPPARATAGSSAPAPSHPNPGFSREFLNAGIEEMSTLREWHTALETAIQNGIPLSEGLLQPYRAQATTNLRLVSVAASTPGDHDGFQLLNNVYKNMETLSSKYITMRSNLSYIAPDALKSDELNQRIIACGRSLRAMAASGQFSDDGSCH